jgi:hypothetical protein
MLVNCAYLRLCVHVYTVLPKIEYDYLWAAQTTRTTKSSSAQNQLTLAHSV